MNTDNSHRLHGVVATAATRKVRAARPTLATCATVSTDARMSRLGVLLAIATALCALAAAPLRAQQAAGNSRLPERFTGVLANTAGEGTVQVTVHIDSYTSPDEVRSLSTLLEEKGQDAVVAKLFKMKGHGWIRIGSSLGYEVPIISTVPTATGRDIVIVADRPIQFWEQWRGTRSLEYPFGMIVLKLDSSGNGTGKLIAAMRARFEKNGTVELESYGTEPFVIIGVRPETIS